MRIHDALLSQKGHALMVRLAIAALLGSAALFAYETAPTVENEFGFNPIVTMPAPEVPPNGRLWSECVYDRGDYHRGSELECET